MRSAIARLQSPETRLVATSSLYESPHLGLLPEDEFRYPPHLNCVIQLETALTPQELLCHIQRVEDLGGRQRGERWAPRTIDIDILFFGDLVLETESLQIPHAGILSRAFVILPLCDLAPERLLQNGMTVAQVADSASIRSQRIQVYTPV